MKEFIKGIIRARSDQWIGFLALLAITSALSLVIFALASDHKVRCYYLKSATTSIGQSYSIMSDINWADDFIAFTSADEDKVLSVISGLNQCANN